MAVVVSSTRYGADALAELRRVVGQVKRVDPLAPVTVLVPNNVAGIVARRHLSRGLGNGRGAIVGIRFSTVRHLAEQISAATLVAHGRRPAVASVTAAAIRASLDAAPGVFAPVAEHPATSRALAVAHSSLRDLDELALDGVATTSTLSTDVIRLHRETRARLAVEFYDQTDLLHTAVRLLADAQVSTDELGTLVLYLPQDLTWCETALLVALARSSGPIPLHVIAARTGSERADAAVLATLAALGAVAPNVISPAAAGSTASAGPVSNEVKAGAMAQRVLTASDSDDEVRCVVREVVAVIRERPAHRVGVLYANASPYARLLHEHLAEADIVVNGPGDRAANERATCRLLLGLLEAARTGFRRADLLRALGEVSTTTFTGSRISISRWERLSRAAGVVGGPDWELRLATYADRHERDLRTDVSEWRQQRARDQRDLALEMRDFVYELRRRFDSAAELLTWAALGRWARDLFNSLLPEQDRDRLPAEEQYALGVIDRSLAGLDALDGQALRPSLITLAEELGADLESARPRVGRFGEGVLVAPISAAVGLDLDAVWVVGLSEDLYPGRLHEDSLLPERVRDRSNGQLPSIRTRVDAMHRCLVAAFCSAPMVTSSFARGDLRRHTARLPSRWLLPSLRALSGQPDLVATAWEKGLTTVDTGSKGLQAADPGWLHRSPSFAGSVLTTNEPSTAQEWASRAAWAGLDLNDPIVSAAAALTRGRDSPEFTRFDGNLAGVEGLPNYADGERLVSPTSLEHFAGCPHAWFAKQLLRVEPVESPEEVIEISAMDVGNLVHESFDLLVGEAGEQGELPGYGESWSAAQRARLQQIGAVQADRYAAEGRTGHARLWPGQRTQVLNVLDWMIDDDNAWRAEFDARVVASELRFGLRGTAPVRLPLTMGTVVFRGSADKLDQRRDGTLLVTDIKTGSSRDFRTLQNDPVAAGSKLQLPVYALAARAAHGSPTTEVEALYWFVRKDRSRIAVALTPEVSETYAATVHLLVSSIARGAFVARAPESADFAWVQCPYCNPDGLGHSAVRERWEALRHDPALAAYTALVEPDALVAEDGRARS
ncbi:MAG: PD-(D/E)XK nuclease family protein [Humibacillus sp.]|nr:PD-(D/E)XK nuclease family protein [Humibacillus sp.]MDN5776610.1 PD-(D/E)XK nuclease family protein [Humibacillus sp.]